jgi:hypothetical protein
LAVEDFDFSPKALPQLVEYFWVAPLRRMVIRFPVLRVK